MSERMKQALATVRDAQAFKWPFSELLVAIEALDEEVDALRTRVASLEPVPFENARDAEAHEARVVAGWASGIPAPLAGYPLLYISSARALALADAVRAFLDETGFRYATPPPAPFNALRTALEAFEKGKAP